MDIRELGMRPPKGMPRQAWDGPFAVCQPSQLDEIIGLREAVWRNEPSLADAKQLDPSALRDEHDLHGHHWFITVEGSIVAAARVCIHDTAKELPYQDGFHHLTRDLPTPIASLNRMVVRPFMRRQGLSRPLTEVRIAAARSRGAKSVIVEAAPNRMPPLSDLGFVELGLSRGEPYDLVPFTLMYLDISG
jgi:predicted GNAT family N-acyltransferase